jgi:hypothetical protein
LSFCVIAAIAGSHANIAAQQHHRRRHHRPSRALSISLSLSLSLAHARARSFAALIMSGFSQWPPPTKRGQVERTLASDWTSSANVDSALRHLIGPLDTLDMHFWPFLMGPKITFLDYKLCTYGPKINFLDY